MGTIHQFPSADPVNPTLMPTVLTGDVIARISQCNRVSRMLRQLGYRILDEDVCPDDDGAPIIQIDLAGLRTRTLEHLADAMTTFATGVVRVQIEGVRVFWERSCS